MAPSVHVLGSAYVKRSLHHALTAEGLSISGLTVYLPRALAALSAADLSHPFFVHQPASSPSVSAMVELGLGEARPHEKKSVLYK